MHTETGNTRTKPTCRKSCRTACRTRGRQWWCSLAHDKPSYPSLPHTASPCPTHQVMAPPGEPSRSTGWLLMHGHLLRGFQPIRHEHALPAPVMVVLEAPGRAPTAEGIMAAMGITAAMGIIVPNSFSLTPGLKGFSRRHSKPQTRYFTLKRNHKIVKVGKIPLRSSGPTIPNVTR